MIRRTAHLLAGMSSFRACPSDHHAVYDARWAVLRPCRSGPAIAIPGQRFALEQIGTKFHCGPRTARKVSVEGPIMLRKLITAAALLTIVGSSTPVLASENWPDSVD